MKEVRHKITVDVVGGEAKWEDGQLREELGVNTPTVGLGQSLFAENEGSTNFHETLSLLQRKPKHTRSLYPIILFFQNYVASRLSGAVTF